MTLLYTWIYDPEPMDWPPQLRFKYGELVRVVDVEILEGRTAVIAGYDELGDGGMYRYVTYVEREDVSWKLDESFLEATGAFDAARLPRRIRPILGDGTVVRLLNTDETRSLGLSGKLALTEGLWWEGELDEPQGYLIKLPSGREVHPLSFGAFEIIEGTDRSPPG